ncbi:SixA phosphatase family protein [Labrys miyagiensis]|nr:histidine phosphatase family protein [Labrys miyagiensis]
MPNKIFVMRHAEKMDDPNDPNLSEAGRARAQALVKWFPEKFGRPDFIFATSISRHSERPIQTVMPLAENLGLPLNSTFADQDYGALAKLLLTEPKFAGKSILVCWHHGNIPSLMNRLGASVGTYPDPWNSKVFDLLLEADYTEAGQPKVSQITESF